MYVPPTVVTLGWVSLITDVSSEMVVAVLPLFVMLQLGLSPAAYGAIEGIYQAGSVVARLAGGYLGDTRQPKWVAAVGYAVSAMCKLLLVFATSFSALIAIISLDRCGKGLRTAPRDALIATASQPDELDQSFGVHRMMSTFGALVGPLLAWIILLLATDDFILIFLITEHGDVPMAVRAMKAGAVEFLTKPFRDQDLLDAFAQRFDAIRRGCKRALR